MNSNLHRLPMPLLLLAVITALWLSTLSAARAAEADPIGAVKTVTGEAWIKSGDSEVRAQAGMPVVAGATVRTGADGALGLTLKDNTVMSLGPRTELTIDEFVFDPGHDKLSLVLRMTRGTLNFISGLIAKLRPEAQVVRTPTGTIGVRGTHFLVKAED
ncbi:MAG: FecR domain-containing protein [Burkholderiales bacterium]|nr:FecR domain-containing protein [Burkholderiales bacterium]